MPNREAPANIQKALRAYDPTLELKWVQEPVVSAAAVGWYFFWHGRRIYRWTHHDGEPAMNDLSEAELGRILASMDNQIDGPDRLRAMMAANASRKCRVDENLKKMCEDARRESEGAARLIRYGPRPFVSGATCTA